MLVRGSEELQDHTLLTECGVGLVSGAQPINVLACEEKVLQCERACASPRAARHPLPQTVLL